MADDPQARGAKLVCRIESERVIVVRRFHAIQLEASRQTAERERRSVDDERCARRRVREPIPAGRTDERKKLKASRRINRQRQLRAARRDRPRCRGFIMRDRSIAKRLGHCDRSRRRGDRGHRGNDRSGNTREGKKRASGRTHRRGGGGAKWRPLVKRRRMLQLRGRMSFQSDSAMDSEQDRTMSAFADERAALTLLTNRADFRARRHSRCMRQLASDCDAF
jgi:hypothetical protein